jgi:hypothetical protein
MAHQFLTLYIQDSTELFVKEAAEGYSYDGPKPKYIRLHLIRNELLTMECASTKILVVS